MPMSRPVDNLIVLPGALAAECDYWQAVANRLPAGAVLVVLPAEPGRQRDTLTWVAQTLSAQGRQVMVETVVTAPAPVSFPAPPSLPGPPPRPSAQQLPLVMRAG